MLLAGKEHLSLPCQRPHLVAAVEQHLDLPPIIPHPAGMGQPRMELQISLPQIPVFPAQADEPLDLGNSRLGLRVLQFVPGHTAAAVRVMAPGQGKLGTVVDAGAARYGHRETSSLPPPCSAPTPN